MEQAWEELLSIPELQVGLLSHRKFLLRLKSFSVYMVG